MEMNRIFEQAVIVESTEYTTINFPFVANSEANAFLYLALFSANETAHIKDISLIEVNENGEELSCDTVVNLNLTILNSTNGTDTQTHCESYTWIDGITYTQSNDSATFVLTNSVGCDSVVTLDLTILNATSGTDTQTHCDSYTWIDGITYTQSNDSATFVLANSVGCDSVVTLDLTILDATSGTDTQTHCDSYTWIDGITYTQSNDSATFVLANSVGCDSVVTLDLTILDLLLVERTPKHTAIASHGLMESHTPNPMIAPPLCLPIVLVVTLLLPSIYNHSGTLQVERTPKHTVIATHG